MKVCNPDTTPVEMLRRERVVIEERTGSVYKHAFRGIPARGSEEAEAIREAHAAYKRSIGTADESAAYARLEAVVLEAKGQR